MLSIANAELTVSILDPVADQAKLGHRYCTGGEIFQIADSRWGNLLSGPTAPHDYNTYDAQGIPDVFLDHLAGPEGEPHELGIGIGLIHRESRNVTEFCNWTLAATPTSLRLTTSHDWHGWALTLEREVVLHRRTVTSHTRVTNTGGRSLPLTWFPHPFYPPSLTGELCRLDAGYTVPTGNAGYELGPQGWVVRKAPWSESSLVRLEGAPDLPGAVTILQKHCKLGLVAARYDYQPDVVVLWGNDRSFSFEPYLKRTVAPGESTQWAASYDF